jgi:hypothetical protein
MAEKKDFYIGATPDDLAWREMTKHNQDHLDSRVFEDPRYEKMKYAPYVQQIASIVEQEMGFKPDLRVASIQDFEAFKRYQKEALTISQSGKPTNERWRTVQTYLGLMSQTICHDLIQYNLEAWQEMGKRIAKEHGLDPEDEDRVDPYVWAKTDRLRDRLAAEIPVIE